MDVATFVQKAEALEKLGYLALLSSDYTVLKTEVKTAAAQLRAEHAAAKKARRPLPFCPPGEVSMEPQELLTHMRAVPVAQRRRLQVKDALRRMLVRKYPCRR